MYFKVDYQQKAFSNYRYIDEILEEKNRIEDSLLLKRDNFDLLSFLKNHNPKENYSSKVRTLYFWPVYSCRAAEGYSKTNCPGKIRNEEPEKWMLIFFPALTFFRAIFCLFFALLLQLLLQERSATEPL